VRTRDVLGLVLITATLAGCAGEPEPQGPVERYDLRGAVVGVNRDTRTVTVKHEEIPGFMTAMTMPFNVRDDWVLEAAEPGAKIRAILAVQDLSSWIEEVVITAPASGGAAADVMVPQAQPGDAVPSIELTDQDGNRLVLADLEGSWYAFTFIYTRCPLPDFCPRMSEQFKVLQAEIESDPERYGDARLLSITIDPAYDSPAVLREYGLRYLASRGDAAFSRWRFARAEPDLLGELTGFTGLRHMPEGSEVVHNLRTVLVDPDGRVVELFVGNTWLPDELLAALAGAVAARVQ